MWVGAWPEPWHIDPAVKTRGGYRKAMTLFGLFSAVTLTLGVGFADGGVAVRRDHRHRARPGRRSHPAQRAGAEPAWPPPGATWRRLTTPGQIGPTALRLNRGRVTALKKIPAGT
ncbi:hypothetical protein GCM10018952_18530 [Streptosporangium vulgare]